ncbi:hypothetical protein F1C58_04600 [Glaciihabitans sp. INWT7]|uniref:hypothetical protein n=1 Tax=Glaciihabitans sp. INWT7 TaxID=2596912 RepID=UPI001626668A|nr:hypothetical protein [Glaciihabitans sp. INWT7]QNE46260.1 hypothetical protein F1C58_04600 [Glaciihabitans sp. INWT7]
MSVVPGKPPRKNSAQVEKGVERLLSVQRPVVLLHIRSIRRRNPDASPAQVIKILESRYLAAVTAGGAAVGASSVIPGVGVGISLALSGVETAGFLESSALFAQSVTEVHGIAVEDPERARTLVMAMMLGTAGSDLVKQLAGQAAGVGPTRGRFWGELVTKSVPQAAMGQIGDRIKKSFIKRFVATQSASVVGRAIPFGIGAVIGGTGNHMLGRKVVSSSRDAFGPAPMQFPVVLEPIVRSPVVLTRRARINLPRFGSGTADSKTPKTPRPPKALRPPKP